MDDDVKHNFPFTCLRINKKIAGNRWSLSKRRLQRNRIPINSWIAALHRKCIVVDFI